MILVNLGVLIAYLLVCLVPYINTGKQWYLGVLGLAFPLLLLALVCFILFWTVLKSRWAWVSLIAMLVGIQQIIAVISFHFPHSFSAEKQPNTLRVMEWNVEGWEEKDKMMEVVKEQNADILCFEEYVNKNSRKDSSSNIATIVKMGYPFYLFAPTKNSGDPTGKGVIIFSKYPIVGTDTFSYGRHTQAEHLIYVDIKPRNQTFRIFTTHLQSVRFEASDYGSLSRLRHAHDPGYRDSKTIISKLKTGYQYRYEQALRAREKIAESPFPVVITGDFNDVPNSNTYFTIKGNLQDAFLKKGSWIGRTFRFISPTLRIDYVLADKKFRVDQFRVIHVPYSDHYPIIADLQY
jgi:endonuclease/exonuclease/phosphatase family metal-dependent hydrolase